MSATVIGILIAAAAFVLNLGVVLWKGGRIEQKVVNLDEKVVDFGKGLGSLRRTLDGHLSESSEQRADVRERLATLEARAKPRPS